MISEFDLWLSDEIWIHIKGKKIPENYSDKDRIEIIKRYWHRVMEAEVDPDARNIE